MMQIHLREAVCDLTVTVTNLVHGFHGVNQFPEIAVEVQPQILSKHLQKIPHRKNVGILSAVIACRALNRFCNAVRRVRMTAPAAV